MAINLNTPSIGNWVSASTFSFSHDAGSAARRVLWLAFSAYRSDAGSLTATVTYAGSSMTEDTTGAEVFAAGGQIARASIFRLNSPPSGANTVEVTLSASTVVWAYAAAVTAADCSGVGNIGTPVNGNISTYDVQLNTASANNLILGSWGTAGARQITEGSSVTLVAEDNSTATIWMGQKQASGSTHRISWTGNSNVRSAGVGLEAVEDTGGAPPAAAVSPYRLTLMGVT